MAGPGQGKTAAGRAGALSALCVLAALLMAPAPRAGAQNAPPAFITRECMAPGTATASESPLPNVALALQRRKRIKILAIGASSSAGLGASKGGYHDVIRRMLEQTVKGLNVQIVHRGVSGELAQNAAQRLKIEVGLNAPDLVLWQVGTNDALSYVPVERVEEVVSETVRWLKDHKVDVVLVGLQYVSEMARDSHYQAIRLALRRIAQTENVIIVRRYEAMETLRRAQGAEPGSSLDEFAYNEAAYNCMAQYVARAISVALFGRELRPTP